MAGAADESILKLAISMHSNRGVYALLLGSGVSRSAGIPTGWEIVTDLINRVAVAAGVTTPTNPEAWYRERFGTQPNYTKLLEDLAATPMERRGLLRAYFEPTKEEQEQGLKVPAPAHRAIARLVDAGHVRLILTTNFDRLIETALRDAGIEPDVVSSNDDLRGTVPLIHSECMVLKLHGDYLDTRIKNTERELARYSKLQNEFLDKVLDEFGLIVCGWSGEWDKALVSAIARCPTRRFTTYWMARGSLGEEAETLVAKRKAEVVSIDDADHGFTQLDEKIEALKDRPHALSGDVAIATVKKYLSDVRFRIPLLDLFEPALTETDEKLHSEDFPTHTTGRSDNETIKVAVHKRLADYESLTEKLLAMTITLAYYDTGHYGKLLTTCVERLSSFPMQAGLNVLLGLRRYPALLTVYGGGIAALATDRYENLASVLLNPQCKDDGSTKTVSAASILNTWLVFGSAYSLVPRPDAAREHTPANLYIRDVLAPRLQAFCSGTRYENLFDRFEYILALAHTDALSEEQRMWAPPGIFTPRHFGLMGDWGQSALKDYSDELVEQGVSSPLVRAGFFGNSVERQRAVVARVTDFFTENSSSW